jgi:cytochrome c
MLDTMKATKAVAAICATWLAFLLITWAGDIIYEGGHGGHGEGQAYTIAVEEAAPEEPAEPEVPFADLYAAADAAAGESLFRACTACHKLDGTDGTGPHLNGVVDRAKASVEGFAYSEGALAQAGEQWTPENLSAFLEAPRDYMPGTKMTYNGMPDAQDRANLIAYLAGTGG